MVWTLGGEIVIRSPTRGRQLRRQETLSPVTKITAIGLHHQEATEALHSRHKNMNSEGVEKKRLRAEAIQKA